MVPFYNYIISHLYKNNINKTNLLYLHVLFFKKNHVCYLTKELKVEKI